MGNSCPNCGSDNYQELIEDNFKGYWCSDCEQSFKKPTTDSKIFVFVNTTLYEMESFKDGMIWLKGANEPIHINDKIIKKVFSADVIDCPTCDGTGQVKMTKHMSMKCKICAGNGRVINDKVEVE